MSQPPFSNQQSPARPHVNCFFFPLLSFVLLHGLYNPENLPLIHLDRKTLFSFQMHLFSFRRFETILVYLHPICFPITISTLIIRPEHRWQLLDKDWYACITQEVDTLDVNSGRLRLDGMYKLMFWMPKRKFEMSCSSCYGNTSAKPKTWASRVE